MSSAAEEPGASGADPAEEARTTVPIALAVLLVFLASRLVVAVVALVVESTVTLPPELAASSSPILQSLTTSDATWYLGIAANGYHAEAIRGPYHDFAYFPLYPLAVRLASVVVPDLGLAGVLVANLAFGGALVAFVRLSGSVLTRQETLAATVLLAFAPGAVAFSMAYAESLFLLLSLGALLAARRRAYPAMSLLFGLLALTRLTGILVLVPLIVIVGQQAGWHRHRTWAWLASGPLALAGYLGFLWWLTGDPLAYPRAQAAWNDPVDTVAPPGLPAVPTQLIALLIVVVVGLYLFQLVYLRTRRLPRADVAYLVGALLALAATVRLVSTPRWLAVLWPVPWLLVRRRSSAFTIAAITASVVGYVVFAWLHFTTLLAP